MHHPHLPGERGPDRADLVAVGSGLAPEGGARFLPRAEARGFRALPGPEPRRGGTIDTHARGLCRPSGAQACLGPWFPGAYAPGYSCVAPSALNGEQPFPLPKMWAMYSPKGEGRATNAVALGRHTIASLPGLQAKIIARLRPLLRPGPPAVRRPGREAGAS